MQCIRYTFHRILNCWLSLKLIDTRNLLRNPKCGYKEVSKRTFYVDRRLSLFLWWIFHGFLPVLSQLFLFMIIYLCMLWYQKWTRWVLSYWYLLWFRTFFISKFKFFIKTRIYLSLFRNFKSFNYKNPKFLYQNEMGIFFINKEKYYENFAIFIEDDFFFQFL